MTNAQLNDIEAAVRFPLPPAYRRVAAAAPFRPIGRDCVYWFADDPAAVLDATLDPLADGGYDRAGWRDGYLGIGYSAAGDVYLLDTAADGLPVHCLSHETHAIEPEWPSFAAFVDEWLRAPDEVARQREAEHQAARAVMRAWWRRWWLIVGVIGFFAFVLPLLVLLLAPRT